VQDVKEESGAAVLISGSAGTGPGFVLIGSVQPDSGNLYTANLAMNSTTLDTKLLVPTPRAMTRQSLGLFALTQK
jgi:hypothetical protein